MIPLSPLHAVQPELYVLQDADETGVRLKVLAVGNDVLCTIYLTTAELCNMLANVERAIVAHNTRGNSERGPTCPSPMT